MSWAYCQAKSSDNSDSGNSEGHAYPGRFACPSTRPNFPGRFLGGGGGGSRSCIRWPMGVCIDPCMLFHSTLQGLDSCKHCASAIVEVGKVSDTSFDAGVKNLGCHLWFPRNVSLPRKHYRSAIYDLTLEFLSSLLRGTADRCPAYIRPTDARLAPCIRGCARNRITKDSRNQILRWVFGAP